MCKTLGKRVAILLLMRQLKLGPTYIWPKLGLLLARLGWNHPSSPLRQCWHYKKWDLSITSIPNRWDGIWESSMAFHRNFESRPNTVQYVQCHLLFPLSLGLAKYNPHKKRTLNSLESWNHHIILLTILLSQSIYYHDIIITIYL